MRAGELDTRFHLQSRTASADRDSAGGRTSVWSTTATVWAGRIDISGEEDMDGGQEGGTLTATWQIRHRTGLSSDYRMVNADSTGNVWDVDAVFDPDGRRQQLHVRAKRHGV